MEYIIVKADYTDLLMERVNAKLAEGWIVQGGVTVYVQNGTMFIQAMVKESV